MTLRAASADVNLDGDFVLIKPIYADDILRGVLFAMSEAGQVISTRLDGEPAQSAWDKARSIFAQSQPGNGVRQ